MPLASFYTPWRHQKTKGFLMFSGGIKRDQCRVNQQLKIVKSTNLDRWNVIVETYTVKVQLDTLLYVNDWYFSFKIVYHQIWSLGTDIFCRIFHRSSHPEVVCKKGLRGCSFRVNYAKLIRVATLWNTCEWVLLFLCSCEWVLLIFAYLD